MIEQGAREFSGIRMTAEQRQAIECRSCIWQCLRLLIIDHLQAMFNMAQIAIGGQQIIGNVWARAAQFNQDIDCIAGCRDPQIRQPAAPDQLLCLSEELDLANTAAPDLDVMSGDGHFTMTLDGMDLPLDRMNVLDGGEIEVLAPDEGPQVAQELRASGNIAGDLARLDHRRPFPVLPHTLVICLRGQGRDGQRGRAGVRAQPQIGAKDIAVFGNVLQQADEIAGQAYKAFLGCLATAIIDFVRIEEDHQVDVGAVVQLACTQFAQGEDDETTIRQWLGRVGQYKLAFGMELSQLQPDGRSQGDFGEVTQGACYLFQRPPAGNIGGGNEQGCLAFCAPQQAHHGCVIKRDGRLFFQAFQHITEDRVGAIG